MSVVQMHELTIRSLSPFDLDRVAAVHLAAFPDRALTALGKEAIRRYYAWQLSGPHDAIASGAWAGSELVGFCFAGAFRGAMSGFLRRNRVFLAWRVITHPWLVRNALVREHTGVALRVLRRAGKSKSTPDSKHDKANRSFGILSIAVDPRFQGCGVGTQLMRECEDAAHRGGYGGMHLSVDAQNASAIRFYERCGWQQRPHPAASTVEMVKLFASDTAA